MHSFSCIVAPAFLVAILLGISRDYFITKGIDNSTEQ